MRRSRPSLSALIPSIASGRNIGSQKGRMDRRSTIAMNEKTYLSLAFIAGIPG